MDLQKQLVRLRKETGMKRTDFARYFDIPYRTLQDWELGNRKIPEYLLRLMEYKIRMEALLKEKNIDPEQTDKNERDGETGE
ncbi:MAG: transcriptional regulator [Eubacterium sp.]|nr:transcriptional regulator [Eubacterium sp.]